MNETIHTLLNRRSIRKFKNIPVDEEKLKLILKCGHYASTALNHQPWHFTLITNQKILNDISDKVKKQRPDADPSYHVYYHAPAVIMISGKEGESFAEADCANAAMNMCNAAASLNLGSCYIAAFRAALVEDGEYIKEICQISDQYVPLFCVAIGEADEEPALKPRTEQVNVIH